MRRAYPILFALFPLFGMAAGNPGWYRLRSVFLVAAVAILATALLGAALTLLLRVRYTWSAAADRAALLTFIAVALFYTIEPLQIGPIKSWVRGHPVLDALLLVLLAVLTVLTVRKRWYARLPGLAAVSGYLALVGTLLCVWSVAHVLYFPASSALAVHRSAFVDSLEQPVPLRARAGSNVRGPKRDVFVIVLDEYASSQVLRERFGYDNSRFIDSLRALGFRIPSALRSNYANTLLSVGSLVNFAPTGNISSDAGRDSYDYGPASFLIEHNRAARFMKAQGYRYVFFASTWYAPTRFSSEADVDFDPYGQFRLDRYIYRSEFLKFFIKATVLDRLMPYLGDQNMVYRDHVVRTLDGVAGLEPTSQPTFAFVHVLMPHTPYVVDASCHAAAVPQHDRRSMAAQLTCLDSLVLHTVTTLLTKSRVPPIIVLEGDHGTHSLNIFASPIGVPPQAAMAERFRPFGAYYLPDGGDTVMPDSTSIVNVMRYVFSYYFDADLPPLPNTMYYSHYHYPYRLTAIGSDFTPLGRYVASPVKASRASSSPDPAD